MKDSVAVAGNSALLGDNIQYIDEKTVHCMVCRRPCRGSPTHWSFCTRCACLLSWDDAATAAFVRLDTGLGLCFDFTDEPPQKALSDQVLGPFRGREACI